MSPYCLWIKVHGEESNKNLFRVLDQFGPVDSSDVVLRKDVAGREHPVVRAPDSLRTIFESAHRKDDQGIFNFSFYCSRYDEGPIIRVHFLSDLQRSDPVRTIRRQLAKLEKKSSSRN